MESTHSKSDENDIFRKTAQLPENLRDELKEPLGEMVDEAQLENILAGVDRIVTVGDRCSVTLFDAGLIPDIAVVDFMIERGDIGELKEHIKKIGQIVINVKNPPGMLTEELWQAVEKAYLIEEKVRIEVAGEEDLATLPCVWLAPPNTAIIYGLPNIGLVVVLDRHKAKQKVKNVLTKMR